MDLLTIAKKIADRVEAELLKQNVPDAIRRHSAGNALSLDHRPQPLSGLSKPQVRADRQINAGQNPRAPTQARQPCRAFWRGSFLFTTNVRPRRRTTIEPGRTFSPRSEFLTFMI
jgi:hypothetical protein